MALSLNSVAGLKSTPQVKSQNISRCFPGASRQKIDSIAASTRRRFWWWSTIKDNRSCLVISAANDNKVATDSTDKDSRNAGRALSNEQLSPVVPLSLNSSPVTNQPETSAQDLLGRQMPKDSNGLQVPSYVKENISSPPSVQSAVKRSSLTAREKLRAARVLSQYAESKRSKPDLGSKVLDAMRESDRGNKKRPGLPEAPENLLDDSKRGLPKSGLTFDFPGGFDLFLIVFSAVFISTLMFGTTYVVWKAGAIHFNEY
ncbi:hypothetical protein NE237_010806 [Protea cynaroides]|uniref:Uncharacterized protein n=1 Tax=Protea cynaroides TaxID=273540 RepID=A0A9Q0L0X9_9MAGN|nr:hypothetical protein NE237_010806 [Protea cynaroides]